MLVWRCFAIASLQIRYSKLRGASMGHRQAYLKAVILAGAASSGLLWQPAIAQAQVTTADNGNQVEEVVVTARRREENLQKVPLTVTAASGEYLHDQHISDVMSLRTIVPALDVNAGGGFRQPGIPVFTIRGVGTTGLGVGLESSVGLVVDDVPIARIDLADIELFDIANVQVLEGPQGTLFGKNASGGLINIVTEKPELGAWDAIAHGEYGSMTTPTAGNTEHVDLTLNAPIADDMALRLTGFFAGSDGFIKNVYNPSFWTGENNEGVRLHYLWEPTANFRLLVSGDYAVEDGPGEAMTGIRYASSPTGIAGNYVASLSIAAGVTPGPNDVYTAASSPDKAHSTTYGMSANAQWGLGGGYTLTNITAYRGRAETTQLDAMLVPQNISLDPYIALDQRLQFSEELRVTSPQDQRLTWQGGFFYQHLNTSHVTGLSGDFNFLTTAFDSYNAVGHCFVRSAALQAAPYNLPAGCFPLATNAYYLNTASTGSAAGYFEGEYKILDELRITAGGRYTQDKVFDSLNLDPTTYPFAAYPQNAVLAAHNFAFQHSLNHNNFSYRASIEYDIEPNVMAYVSYTRGYKAPTYAAVLGNLVKSEIPNDYEAGVKSQLFDNRLRLNLNYFGEVYQGYQVQGAQQLAPGIWASTTAAAAKLRSHGAELQTTVIPFDGMAINGAAVYNFTQFEGLYFPCPTGAALLFPTGFGTNQCQPSGGAKGLALANGDQLPQAPKWSENITLRYTQPVWDGWSGFLQGTGSFRSSYNFNILPDPTTALGDTAIFGLSMGVLSDDGHVDAQIFVRNLTDQRVPAYIAQSNTDGQTVNIPGHATDFSRYQTFDADSFRTVGVSVDYHM